MNVYVIKVTKKGMYIILANNIDDAKNKMAGSLQPAPVKPPGNPVKYVDFSVNGIEARQFDETKDGEILNSNKEQNIIRVRLSSGKEITVCESTPTKF